MAATGANLYSMPSRRTCIVSRYSVKQIERFRDVVEFEVYRPSPECACRRKSLLLRHFDVSFPRPVWPGATACVAA
jgi:hypothetical protein